MNSLKIVRIILTRSLLPSCRQAILLLKKVEDLQNAFENEMGGYLYSRGLNPTVEILRKKLAALDGAEDCLVFNSGAAAIFAGILANVKAGDHVVSVKTPYTWAQRMFDIVLPRFGVTTTYIDGTNRENTALRLVRARAGDGRVHPELSGPHDHLHPFSVDQT